MWCGEERAGKQAKISAQIATLSSEFETEQEELNKLASEDALRIEALTKDRSEMARIRKADAP
jgi:circadian clock protein KaiC